LKKPRIFHGRVNHGTQAGLFAQELRKNGYMALSVVHPDPFKRITDIELKHGGNFFQRLYNHLWNFLFRISCLFKFDIYHFYYGETLLPYQIDLPILRFFNKKIVMEYLGNDIQGYQQSVEKYKWTNINHMMNADEGAQYDIVIKRRYENEQKFVHKSLVCSPMYSEFAPNAEVLPLAIDVSQFLFNNLPEFNGTFKIMHAPTHRGFKGTNFIESAINKLKTEGYAIDFDLVEGVTHSELVTRYKMCHLFIDQIMGGWYGTASIEAMAIGRPVIVSIRESYFPYIDFGQEIPAIHADPDNIYEVLKNTLDKGFDYLVDKGKAGRTFVEKYHDVKIVTQKLISIYNQL
jgi:glycosyltransferase involved in cell wall biosynthesis